MSHETIQNLFLFSWFITILKRGTSCHISLVSTFQHIISRFCTVVDELQSVRFETFHQLIGEKHDRAQALWGSTFVRSWTISTFSARSRCKHSLQFLLSDYVSHSAAHQSASPPCQLNGGSLYSCTLDRNLYMRLDQLKWWPECRRKVLGVACNHLIAFRLRFIKRTMLSQSMPQLAGVWPVRRYGERR